MDWRDYALARQNLVEKYIGTRLREAKQREDALARKNAETLARQEPKHGPR